MSELDRAIRSFDANRFAKRHRARKESKSQRSHEYLFNCPNCGGHNLRWNSRKLEVGVWICWNCKKTGNTLKLIQVMENLDLDGAVRFVLDGYTGGDANLDLTTTAVAKAPTTRSTRVELKRLPLAKWPNHVQVISRAHPHAWNYATQQRGLTEQMLRDYHVAVGVRGRYQAYLVFPIYMDGGLVYWQARATWDPPAELTKGQRNVWVDETKWRKTLNPWEGEVDILAERVLFNHDRAKTAGHIVVCEGPIDAMKVGPHAVALLGKTATGERLERLRRMSARRYTIYLDRGEEEAACARQLAADLSTFADVFVATPPEGFDPGKLSPEQNAHIVGQAEPYCEVLSTPLS